MDARIVGHTPLPLAVEIIVEFLDGPTGELLARRSYNVDTDDPDVLLDQVAADSASIAAQRYRRDRLYAALIERGLIGGRGAAVVDLAKHETERAPVLAALREAAGRAALDGAEASP